MPIKDKDIDLLRDPAIRAKELYDMQLDAVKEQILPQQRLSPTAQWLHSQGLTLKEMRERVEGNRVGIITTQDRV